MSRWPLLFDAVCIQPNAEWIKLEKPMLGTALDSDPAA
ncbi:MAG: hypothetical protein RLZZ611_2443, partial [Cyanobacteriota bacterium]